MPLSGVVPSFLEFEISRPEILRPIQSGHPVILLTRPYTAPAPTPPKQTKSRAFGVHTEHEPVSPSSCSHTHTHTHPAAAGTRPSPAPAAASSPTYRRPRTATWRPHPWTIRHRPPSAPQTTASGTGVGSGRGHPGVARGHAPQLEPAIRLAFCSFHRVCLGFVVVDG
jgi:hypothetical protein